MNCIDICCIGTIKNKKYICPWIVEYKIIDKVIELIEIDKNIITLYKDFQFDYSKIWILTSDKTYIHEYFDEKNIYIIGKNYNKDIANIKGNIIDLTKITNDKYNYNNDYQSIYKIIIEKLKKNNI